jgi:hypothetical protein
MNFVYHLVPENLCSTVLYPLNQLKIQLPTIYAIEVKKYSGRLALLKRKIPQLDCMWNDVLHFSPVPPEKIQAALQQAGFQPPAYKWFEIDPRACNFTSANTVIYLSPSQDRNDFITRESDFEPFSLERLSQLTEMPPASIEYYKHVKVQGGRPLLFHHIPHVLFLGCLETGSLKVISA